MFPISRKNVIISAVVALLYALIVAALCDFWSGFPFVNEGIGRLMDQSYWLFGTIISLTIGFSCSDRGLKPKLIGVFISAFTLASVYLAYIFCCFYISLGGNPFLGPDF